MSSLVIDRLSKRFAGTTAVADVSVAIEDGELVCLLGPSGCGKSTVLRMVAGFERPSEGRILIDGQDVSHLPPERRPTGMVFQSHALWSHMTVAGNIAFGLRLRGLPRETIRARVAEVLALVGLEGYEKRSPRQLSGGQQQRVAIARCVVLEPKILLMDEPFSALDAHLRTRLREEVRAIQRRLGLTTIFVTHDQEEALTLADRVVVMRAGSVEQVGSPGAIYAAPATRFVAGFIGTMNMIEADVVRGVANAAGLPIRVDGPDGRYTIAMRPEDLAIRQPPAPSPWRGRVERVLDLGAFRMLDVVLATGPTIKLQVPKSLAVAAGEDVALTIGAVFAYDDGGRARPASVAEHSVRLVTIDG